MKKRIVAFCLCMTILLGLLPSAFATVNVAEQFKDVKKKDWFYKSVDYAYNNGLFSGTSATTFGPEENMTRAMFVTVLGRLEGVVVNHKQDVRFADVKPKQYYTGFVKWASDNGIVSGTSDREFGPDEYITREQICAIVLRYCDYGKIALEETVDAVTFKDASKISKYARKAVSACQRSGLVSGEGTPKMGYSFRPQGNATRAEVATILMNFAKKYGALHNWTAGEATVDGCITTTPYTCDHCEEIKNVATSNHTIVKSGGVNAGCASKGKTAMITCSKCNVVFAQSTTLPVLGHDMNGGKCSRCGCAMDVYSAAGYAAARLFNEINPSEAMYMLEAKYVKGCMSVKNQPCANGAYTFYFKYKIGASGSQRTAIIGIHIDSQYVYYEKNHKANDRCKNGAAMDVQKVMDYGNAWLEAIK